MFDNGYHIRGGSAFKGGDSMLLSMAIEGQNVILRDINWGYKLRKRLQDMGLTPGVEVNIVSSNSRGAFIIKLRGTKLVIGRGIAQKLLVDIA